MLRNHQDHLLIIVSKRGMSRKQCKRSSTDRFIRLLNLTTLCYYNPNESVLKEFGDGAVKYKKHPYKGFVEDMLKLVHDILR